VAARALRYLLHGIRATLTVAFVAVARALGGRPPRPKADPRNLPAQVERDRS
jgi:hypothetical protein